MLKISGHNLIKNVLLLFLLLIAEFGIYILIVIIYSYIGTRLCPSFFPRMKLNCLFNGLLLANFGQLLVIPTVIWGQSENLAYRRLTVVFIALSNIQAYKGRLNTNFMSAVHSRMIHLSFVCFQRLVVLQDLVLFLEYHWHLHADYGYQIFYGSRKWW